MVWSKFKCSHYAKTPEVIFARALSPQTAKPFARALRKPGSLPIEGQLGATIEEDFVSSTL
jgi:hypothetical protein